MWRKTMKLLGKIKTLVFLNKKQVEITLIVDTTQIDVLEELKSRDKLFIQIRKYVKSRSLDANRYFWKLLTQYAEEKQINAIDEYKERVKRLGIFRVSRVEKKDVETYKRIWESWGTAWICEVYDTEYIGKLEFKILHLYYGSSSFNSKQMSRLINDLVDDCKEVGIPTEPKVKINKLLEGWDKK